MIRGVLTVCASLSLVGCTTLPAEEEEIAYSSSWFSCKNRFNCVVVYDAFCKFTAVNARSAIVYQDWSLQEVIRQGERAVCPGPQTYNEVAGCTAGRCVYPFRFGGDSEEEK